MSAFCVFSHILWGTKFPGKWVFIKQGLDKFFNISTVLDAPGTMALNLENFKIMFDYFYIL